MVGNPTMRDTAPMADGDHRTGPDATGVEVFGRQDNRHDPDSFDERVYAVVRQIPRGKVATYGQIARLVGAPRMARFVGFALHRNPYEGVVPCHRVVFADGGLAPGFAFGGPGEQRKRLEQEGVTFCEGRGSHGTDRVDLSACQW